MRSTPFAFVFGDIAPRRFPAIAEALEQTGGLEADRDRFVLLEPVGRLLREIVPGDAGAEALEAHVCLLHHAFCHWAAHAWVYRIGDAVLRRALTQDRMTSRLPRPALYLQLPELRVWGTPSAGDPAEPLDGIFVTQAGALPDGVAVLGIFGMRPDRPGFSAVGLEGRADPDDPNDREIEIASARVDGTPPFGPTLAGGTAAGLYSVQNPGELLLLTCRLLALLPARREPESEIGDALERVVAVE